MVEESSCVLDVLSLELYPNTIVLSLGIANYGSSSGCQTVPGPTQGIGKYQEAAAYC